MSNLPNSCEGWELLWSQAQVDCSGDSGCPGWVVFEQVKEAFRARQSPKCPGEHATHPLGMLLTDLAVDHGLCIRACLQNHSRGAFVNDLSMQTERTMGLAAAALSFLPNPGGVVQNHAKAAAASWSRLAAEPCTTCRRQKCRSGKWKLMIKFKKHT